MNATITIKLVSLYLRDLKAKKSWKRDPNCSFCTERSDNERAVFVSRFIFIMSRIFTNIELIQGIKISHVFYKYVKQFTFCFTFFYILEFLP